MRLLIISRATAPRFPHPAWHYRTARWHLWTVYVASRTIRTRAIAPLKSSMLVPIPSFRLCEPRHWCGLGRRCRLSTEPRVSLIRREYYCCGVERPPSPQGPVLAAPARAIAAAPQPEGPCRVPFPCLWSGLRLLLPQPLREPGDHVERGPDFRLARFGRRILFRVAEYVRPVGPAACGGDELGNVGKALLRKRPQLLQ
jgi:hypothetical protein